VKKVLALVTLAIVFVLAAPAVEAQHDLSAYYKLHDGVATAIPWYVYSSPSGNFVDARYNFDALDSLAVFAGKSFIVGGVTVTPAIGGIVGKYDGVSGEVNLAWKLWGMNWFTLNQYSAGVGESRDFTYHYMEALYPLGRHVQVGFDEQWWWSPGGKGEWDYGPVLKLKTSDGLYLKTWVAATNTGPHKLFVGFGFTR